MGRSPCCDDQTGLKKGPWTTEEDQKLVDYINTNGHGSWRALPKLAGLNRCGKSCRLRWTNYLRPDIKRGKFSEEEERVIINLHAVVGNKWSKIATHLPGRTDNEIKNYWNTHLRKKLLQMGLDPNTHKPRTDLNHLLNLSQLLGTVNVGDMMTSTPWDNALRLQNINLCGGNFTGASTMVRGQEWNPDSIPGAPNELNTISYSLDGFEGLNRNININLMSSCYDIQSFKNQFAELVSSSPGSSTTNNQIESTSTGDIPAAGQSSPTSIFETWEKLMDDDMSESYWKDILQSMS